MRVSSRLTCLHQEIRCHPPEGFPYRCNVVNRCICPPNVCCPPQQVPTPWDQHAVLCARPLGHFPAFPLCQVPFPTRFLSTLKRCQHMPSLLPCCCPPQQVPPPWIQHPVLCTCPLGHVPGPVLHNPGKNVSAGKRGLSERGWC